MKTVGERLFYLINTKEVSMRKFCEKYNLSYQSINPICNNRRELGINILNDLKEVFPTLNVNWLLYGQGEINCTISGTPESNMILQEPNEKYNYDPVEETFLHYLENENVRNKIKQIIKKEIK